MQEEIKQKLLMHLNFLEEELKDYPLFERLTWEIFRTDRSKRRDAERWIENIVNSSIDISKIMLTSEGISLPDNYRDIVLSLSLIEDFDKETSEMLSRWVRFRNIIAHEYLDVRWSSIKKFISETNPLYEGFLNKAKKYLKRKLSEERKEGH